VVARLWVLGWSQARRTATGGIAIENSYVVLWSCDVRLETVAAAKKVKGNFHFAAKAYPQAIAEFVTVFRLTMTSLPSVSQ
jgi:hypothetical protein